MNLQKHPSSRETEARGTVVQSQPGLYMRPKLKKQTKQKHRDFQIVWKILFPSLV
jgi:hypothetical protein